MIFISSTYQKYKKFLYDYLITDIVNTWLCLQFRGISNSFPISINFRTCDTYHEMKIQLLVSANTYVLNDIPFDKNCS